MPIRYRQRPADRQGAILVLIAVLIPVICVLAAFAVDIAWMQLATTELRTATDFSARAGAKVLSLEQNTDDARAAAIDAASRNLVAGEGLRVAPAAVQFGRSEQPNSASRFIFTPTTGGLINAIHVDGLRTAGSPAGPVNLIFARILGVDTFEPRQEAVSTVLDRDLCLVIDRSGSMGLDLRTTGDRNGQNCGPLDRNTRFAALDRAIEAFLVELDSTFPNEQVALASYSSRFQANCRRGANIDFQEADIRQQLTQDYNLIRAQMNQFMLNGIGGSTAIGEGLRRGIEAITSRQARPFAVKTIVLMTDGLHNRGVEPIVLAREAARQDITVHTISFSRGADQVRMRQVATATGGKHFHADTAGDLTQIFQEIARTLPVLLTQ